MPEKGREEDNTPTKKYHTHLIHANPIIKVNVNDNSIPKLDNSKRGPQSVKKKFITLHFDLNPLVQNDPTALPKIII